MMASFSVRTTAHFDRQFRKLAKRHPDLVSHYAEVLKILAAEPRPIPFALGPFWNDEMARGVEPSKAWNCCAVRLRVGTPLASRAVTKAVICG